jgi:hypothetical protein
VFAPSNVELGANNIRDKYMQSSSSSEDDNNGTKNKQIVNKPVPFRPKFVFEKKASSKLKLNIDDDEAPVTKKGSIFNHLKTDLSPIK